jgi:hypothetical protein
VNKADWQQLGRRESTIFTTLATLPRLLTLWAKHPHPTIKRLSNFSGSPSVFVRTVAFRPSIAAGVAFFWRFTCHSALNFKRSKAKQDGYQGIVLKTIVHL